MSSIDIWKILAGIAFFLLGIKFLEESLQQFAGRRFKLFLKKQTSHKLKAIGGGEIVTAFKSLFFGLKEFLLDKNQSRHFDELPGFIR